MENDLALKLDHEDARALIAARIAERNARIEANNHNRKKLRAEKAKGAEHKDAKDADKASKDAHALADSHKATFETKVAAVKAKHSVTDDAAETLHDAGQGLLILKAQATVAVKGPGPAIERKRIEMPDADCDTYATSYATMCAASDEATDLQRQINDYLVSHEPPALSPGGEPAPEPQALLDLRAAFAAKVAVTKAEMTKQGEIVQKALAGETVTYSVRSDIATGEIVLGDKPADLVPEKE
jgi:hypothetical protein